MQFLIEHIDPSADEMLHTAVVTGRSGVLDAAGELAGGDRATARQLEAISRCSEGELAGDFGVFRFAPVG